MLCLMLYILFRYVCMSHVKANLTVTENLHSVIKLVLDCTQIVCIFINQEYTKNISLCYQMSFNFQQCLTVCCANAGVKMNAVPHWLQERFQSLFWSFWCPTIVSKHWSAVCLLDIEVSSCHQWQCTTSCPFQSRSNASKHKVHRSSMVLLI